MQDGKTILESAKEIIVTQEDDSLSEIQDSCTSKDVVVKKAQSQKDNKEILHSKEQQRKTKVHKQKMVINYAYACLYTHLFTYTWYLFLFLSFFNICVHFIFIE